MSIFCNSRFCCPGIIVLIGIVINNIDRHTQDLFGRNKAAYSCAMCDSLNERRSVLTHTRSFTRTLTHALLSHFFFMNLFLIFFFRKLDLCLFVNLSWFLTSLSFARHLSRMIFAHTCVSVLLQCWQESVWQPKYLMKCQLMISFDCCPLYCLLR